MAKTIDKKVVLRLKCERHVNCLDMPDGADQTVTMVPVHSCIRCDYAIVDVVSIEDYEEDVPKPDVKSVVEKQDELGLG